MVMDKGKSEQKYVSAFLKPLKASSRFHSSGQSKVPAVPKFKKWGERDCASLEELQSHMVCVYKEGIKHRSIKAINLPYLTIQGKMSKLSWVCVYWF